MLWIAISNVPLFLKIRRKFDFPFFFAQPHSVFKEP